MSLLIVLGVIVIAIVAGVVAIAYFTGNHGQAAQAVQNATVTPFPLTTRGVNP
jgi:flagellar basal body-associated protein FliL